MTTDAVNQEQSAEERNAVIDNAMKAEMAQIMGAETTTPAEEPKIPDAKETAQEEVKPEIEDDKPAAPTIEEQLQAVIQENQKLKKSIDSTNGRYGNELQQLRARLDAVNNSGLEKQFANLNIDNPVFETLKADYPELVTGLVEGFRKALIGEAQAKNEQQTQTQQVSQQQEPKQADPVATQDPTTKRLALDALQRQHPDFDSVAGFQMTPIARGVNKIEWKNKEFGEWVESMPDDVRDIIINGGTEEDPSPQTILQVLDVLTDFKKAKPSTTDQPASTNQQAEPEVTKASVHQIKPDLSKSILPSGRNPTGKVTLTREEVIEEAKRKEMARHMVGR